MPELKPCPFCGTKPKLEYDYNLNTSIVDLYLKVTVKCPHCFIYKSEGFTFDKRQSDPILKWIEVRDSAVNEWNTRNGGS